MKLRIATWNVNSVRLRVDHAARFVAEQAPDVLCLQEIKCQAEQFPIEAFVSMGLPHVKITGQKGWHGVAIASRYPIEEARGISACRNGHARCVSGTVAGVEIQNFYIPAGGDTPDRDANEKFDHKLDFYDQLTRELSTRNPGDPLVVTGDLNVAPGEFDVWNHRYMSKIVSHTPVEVEAFQKLVDSIGLIDIVREATPEPEKLASWWSYRAQDFRKSNRGLRLDHLLLSPGLRDAAFRQGAPAARIHDDVREWERPSDHAPVSVDLVLS